MSLVVAGAAAGLYAATVVGIHRYGVRRRRRRSGGFPVLARIDWDALLQGLSPRPRPEPSDAPSAEARHALLGDVVAGAVGADLERRAAEAGLAGGETEWLRTLGLLHASPLAALERLERAPATTAQELYLREHLRLIHRANAFNLELIVFGAKRRLGFALARFGDVPCLFFARAFASAKVGMNHAAIDDLARAVYFSQQAPFYVRAVLDTPYIEEARPVLTYQCRRSLAEQTRSTVAG